jgi:hypothetical protein
VLIKKIYFEVDKMEHENLFNKIFGDILQITRNNVHPTNEIIRNYNFHNAEEEPNDRNYINLDAHTYLVVKAVLNTCDGVSIIYYHSCCDNSRTFEIRPDSN